VRDTNGNFVIGPNTPNIDTLFQQGVTFSMGHCPIGVCRPSLTSLFTGLNPVQSGTYGNDPVPTPSWNQSYDTIYNDIMRCNIEVNPTLPRMLAEKGYMTLQTGKWWEGDYKRAGFTHGQTINASRHMYDHNNPENSIGRKSGSIGSVIGSFVQAAKDAGKPFFISYAPFLPHTPHASTSSTYYQRYASYVGSGAGKITQYQAQYLATIDWFDATIGELQSTLESKGVDPNTVLYVFMADNGWLQTPDGTGPSYGADGGKMTPFENGVRTPIIFYQPNAITDTRRTVQEKLADARLASSTDIMPTLLSWVGAAVPETLQGVNLLSSSQQRQRQFGDTYMHDQPVYTNGKYQIGNPEATRTSYWMIEDNWKLIKVTGHPTGQNLGAAVQLYNLATDPGEKNNLANNPAHATRLAAMTTTLENWWNTNRPKYIYDHEFNGSETVNNVPPDVIEPAGSATKWSATTGVKNNGKVSGNSTAQLPFVPESNKRYELRCGAKLLQSNNDGLALGFLDNGAPSGNPSDDGLGWLRLSGDPNGSLLLDFYARADGGLASSSVFQTSISASELYALTLALITADRDAEHAGEQWAMDVLVNGITKHRHVFTLGNPDIENVGIGGLGSATDFAWINYIQLVEMPAAPVPEPSTFVLAAIGFLGLGVVLVRRRRGGGVPLCGAAR
jgi:uncharacterized sulfatase